MSGDGHLALEAADLWFAYSAGRPVLRGVSVAASAGEITMVLGASGSGKSTLLKLCKGLLAPQRGTVFVHGHAVVATRRSRLDPEVAYIPQHLGLVRNLSVLDNVLMGSLGRVPELASLVRRLPAAAAPRNSSTDSVSATRATRQPTRSRAGNVSVSPSHAP